MFIPYALTGEIGGEQGEVTRRLKMSTFYICTTSRRGWMVGPPLALRGFAPADRVSVRLEFILLPCDGGVEFSSRA